MSATPQSLDYGLNDDHYETIDTETVDTEDDEEGSLLLYSAVVDAPPTQLHIDLKRERLHRKRREAVAL